MIDKKVLINLVEQKLSIRKISLALDTSPTNVRYHLKKFQLKTFATRNSRRTWTDEDLIEALKTSLNIIEIIRKLGLSEKSAGNYETVNRYIDKLDLDKTHLVGRGWVGKTNTNAPGKRSLKEILVLDSPMRSTNSLRERLIKEGIKKEECEKCHLTEWQNSRLPFELDHINGNNRDNRIENLRILCPNCHAQTPTWRKKKNLTDMNN